MRILLATNNPHKAEELRAILADLKGVEILRPDDLGYPIPDPVEDGATLEENAWIKAKEIHDATGLPTIADDTGLEVTALGGEPGVHSARFAGPNATYEDNCRLLLSRLHDAASPDRSARFRTVICYVDDAATFFAEGSVVGEIVSSAKGTAGFGYDPLFRPGGGDRTFAEMAPEEKNAVSHRGRALGALRKRLEAYLVVPTTDDGPAAERSDA